MKLRDMYHSPKWEEKRCAYKIYGGKPEGRSPLKRWEKYVKMVR
jgi:hypothetical protein